MSSELQPCPTCKAVICCEDNPFEFSLVKGPSYGNDQISINVECPPGFSCIPGVYTINKNQIILTVTNTDASVIRIQCCQNEIVQPIPPGSTEAEIGVIAQAMVNSCALQLAQCNSRISYGPVTYQSGPVESNGCANQGLLMGWATGTQPPLPAALFFLNGVIHMKAASFASQTGKTDATNKAQTFLNNYVTSLLFSSGAWDCGYWNTEQDCPGTDPVVKVPAFSYFSTVSQADADAKAITGGCAAHCFDWTTLSWNTPVYDQVGSVTGSISGVSNAFTSTVAMYGPSFSQIICTITADSVWTGESCQSCLVFRVDYDTPVSVLTGGVSVSVGGAPVYVFSTLFAPEAFFVNTSQAGYPGFSNVCIIPITIPAGVASAVYVIVQLGGAVNFVPPRGGTFAGKFLNKRWATVTNDYVMPSVSATVNIKADDLSWLAIGQQFTVSAGGYSYMATMQVTAIISPVEVIAEYVSFAGDNQAGINIPAGQWVFEALLTDF